MEIEWDDRKAAINERKHGIRFSVATEVFEDPMRTLALDSSMDYGEERWVSIGLQTTALCWSSIRKSKIQ